MGNGPPPIGGNSPPSPQTEEAAVELVPVAGAEVISGCANRRHRGASGRGGGTPQPSRKRKRGFSNLR
jgi:hypothetical protein